MQHLSNDVERWLKFFGVNSRYQPLWGGYDIQYIQKHFSESEELVKKSLIKITRRHKRFLSRISCVFPLINHDINWVDIGCNAGFNTFFLYENGINKVLGIESIDEIKIPISIANSINVDRGKISFHQAKYPDVEPRIISDFNGAFLFFITHHYKKGDELDRLMVSARKDFDVLVIQSRMPGDNIRNHGLETSFEYGHMLKKKYGFSNINFIELCQNSFSKKHPVFVLS